MHFCIGGVHFFLSGPHPGNLKIFRSVAKVLVFTSICGPENFRSILSVQETCTKAYESENLLEADVKSVGFD